MGSNPTYLYGVGEIRRGDIHIRAINANEQVTPDHPLEKGPENSIKDSTVFFSEYQNCIRFRPVTPGLGYRFVGIIRRTVVVKYEKHKLFEVVISGRQVYSL